ncbi:MAG: hypothetical protein ABIV21_03385 [Pyrinomonadaceae bacterium]
MVTFENTYRGHIDDALTVEQINRTLFVYLFLLFGVGLFETIDLCLLLSVLTM